MTQDDIFFNGEGDRWFQRNKKYLIPEHKDYVTEIIQFLELDFNNIAELGCGNGWRLEKLRQLYHVECYGIDVSKEAIEQGKGFFA